MRLQVKCLISCNAMCYKKVVTSRLVRGVCLTGHTGWRLAETGHRGKREGEGFGQEIR